MQIYLWKNLGIKPEMIYSSYPAIIKAISPKLCLSYVTTDAALDILPLQVKKYTYSITFRLHGQIKPIGWKTRNPARTEANTDGYLSV